MSNSAINDWVYDEETICNFFSLTMVNCVTGVTRVYEISEWVDDTERLLAVCDWMRSNGQRMVGFNNEGFDYPILHALATGQARGHKQLYGKGQSIIKGQDSNRWGHKIWEPLIPQLDLYLIHHFDNPSKRTSLKVLEFNMRSHLVQEMPVPHDVPMTEDQRETVLAYNFHDVANTLRFYWESRPAIEFRESLGVDHTNFNDGKIGKSFVIRKLEEIAPGTCYVRDPETGRKTARQSRRAVIHLADVILPVIQFDEPEFERIRRWFCNQSITETKGVFKDLTTTVRGFTFVFGTGGLHGSVESKAYESDEEWLIYDADVAAMYPSIGVAWGLYPEHLGAGFCQIHGDIITQRRQHAKGTPENAMLKLAGNSVYGDSNNPYSPFYDPQYTMSITINGQLLLCMLAEKLMALPDVHLIQANTDGMTLYCKRTMLPMVEEVMAWWESVSRLTLEYAEYSRMWIRDVNNYVAEFEGSDKIKRKGAYEYQREWHQDHSELIVAKAVEAAMIEGANIAQYIHGHPDIFDFMLRAKVPRSSRLQLDDGTSLPNLVRYYVSTDGQGISKVMPPPPGCKVGDYKKAGGVNDSMYFARNVTGIHDPSIHTKNQSQYDARAIGINVGRKVTICNHISEAKRSTIDFAYYINQAESLAASAGYVAQESAA